VLQTRVLWSLTRYFGLLTLVFTAIMLIPGISEGIFATPEAWSVRLKRLFVPLPELWLALLPTVFMLSVLATFSRLNLNGDIKIWRAAGASAWPFALTTTLYGLLLGTLMVGPLWPLSQPVDASKPSIDERVFLTPDGVEWMVTDTLTTETGEEFILISKPDGVLRGVQSNPDNDGGLFLTSGWMTDNGLVTSVTDLRLSPASGDSMHALPTDGQWREDLAYRLSYPVVLIGLGLLMLPLALSIDGQRFTLIKITGACLLALNALFVLLITDALARAGIWDEGPFFGLRALIAVAIGLLALALVEERAA